MVIAAPSQCPCEKTIDMIATKQDYITGVSILNQLFLADRVKMPKFGTEEFFRTYFGTFLSFTLVYMVLQFLHPTFALPL